MKYQLRINNDLYLETEDLQYAQDQAEMLREENKVECTDDLTIVDEEGMNYLFDMGDDYIDYERPRRRKGKTYYIERPREDSGTEKHILMRA